MNKIHKLYLFEGLDDQAITSLALDKKEQLSNDGRHIQLYQKGMSHPADMALHAYLSLEEYQEFLDDALAIWNYDKQCTKEELMERILKQTHFEEDHAIIAYHQIAFPSSDYEPLLADLAAREVYDGRLSYPEFKLLHVRRWKQFCKQALNTPNTAFFFLQSLFKNHIQELVGFYDMDDTMILTHLTELITQVLPLNPVLYYVKTEDLYDYITALQNQKDSSLQDLSAFVPYCNYGRLHGLHGTDGICRFLENRFRIEHFVLEHFSKTFPELSIFCCTTDNEILRYPSY